MTTIHFVAGCEAAFFKSFAHVEAAFLVSYAYRNFWTPEARSRVRVRHWILDSGAFTAHSSGRPIELSEYIDYIHAVRASDAPPLHVFGLDVIGDPERSMRNTEEMVRQGLPDVIPTVHLGAPYEVMDEAARYRRVALGGMVGSRPDAQLRFCEEAFARLWPKWIHGFGTTREALLMRLPFSSCDSSSWVVGPMKFGSWSGFSRRGKRSMLPLRAAGRSEMQYGVEVDTLLRLEARLRKFWKRELALVND